MTGELDFIAALRALATQPEARGLDDDVALLGDFVLTHDMIAEGVHYLAADPPESVAAKLVAVTLSDLAAKGATPVGVLLGYCLGTSEWDRGFVAGLGEALAHYNCKHLGGDTIALPTDAPRVLGLTAIGRAGARVPDRAGGRPGDGLWLIGTLGDSAAGLALLLADPAATGPLIEAYRRPRALLCEGRALAPIATAMMDVSDGLLIDARRMAAASQVRIDIDLASLPLSPAFCAARGNDREARLFAATGGDDYALLAALPPGGDQIVTKSLPCDVQMVRVGRLVEGAGIALNDAGEPVELPEHLGHEHRH
ncbi:MAG: thiamine-phosphate kinase [Sphingomicrobium sp.]